MTHLTIAADLSFLIREPAEVYHAKAKEHLSSHTLGDFRRCPLLYRKKQLGLIPETDTAAYRVGRAVHVLVLEGRDRFEGEFVVGGPVNPATGRPYGSNTKAYAEWAAKQTRDVLTDAQAAEVEQMAAAVRDHDEARALLHDGVAEGVVRGAYYGVSCQIRMDWLTPELGLADVKTTRNLDEFEQAIRELHYAHQLAFYRSLLAQAADAHPDDVVVHLIAVEKQEPFRCGVWRMGLEALDVAQRDNERAIGRLRLCRETDHWPTGYEQIRVFDHL